MKKIKEIIIKYKEIITYIIFGVITTIVNWAAYTLMCYLLKADSSQIKPTDNVFNSILHGASGKNLTLLFIANIVAWFVGVIVAFITNKLWVFESKSWKPALVLKELGGFVAARIATGMLEWFVFPALVIAGLNQVIFGIQGFWAKIIVSVAVVVLNYVFSKFLVFKKKKTNKEED
ncbi:MAG: GtrA family protein [Eubacterium sp.]|nr:GtrA family protein [Eubacterium sp.]